MLPIQAPISETVRGSFNEYVNVEPCFKDLMKRIVDSTLRCRSAGCTDSSILEFVETYVGCGESIPATNTSKNVVTDSWRNVDSCANPQSSNLAPIPRETTRNLLDSKSREDIEKNAVNDSDGAIRICAQYNAEMTPEQKKMVIDLKRVSPRGGNWIGTYGNVRVEHPRKKTARMMAILVACGRVVQCSHTNQ